MSWLLRGWLSRNLILSCRLLECRYCDIDNLLLNLFFKLVLFYVFVVFIIVNHLFLLYINLDYYSLFNFLLFLLTVSIITGHLWWCIIICFTWLHVSILVSWILRSIISILSNVSLCRTSLIVKSATIEGLIEWYKISGAWVLAYDWSEELRSLGWNLKLPLILSQSHVPV